MEESISPRQPAGFTLMELLVALGVLSMAAAMLVSAFSSAWFASKPREAARGDQSIVTAQHILRARLERLAAVVRSDSSDPIVDAQGDTRIFSFASTPLPRFGPDALLRYRLIVTPAGDLMLYTANTLDDRIDLRGLELIGWQPTKLLSGVRELELTYFGPDRFSAAGRWQKSWIDRPQPPALIRIRLSFTEGDTRRWPDLIVRPRATVNAACRIQPFSGRCEAI